ncbi:MULTISPECIES: hypothetical protein [Rhizobium]|uniref:hypothetical protein n=1 Tax=Rhizobium TaxID=379 RepID=UPI001C914738|nr:MULTISPECIES: hypothetical protein [Rhizobium]MBY3195075.1 hypothetical protein [Rhizobium laguerreae]MBY5603903.1 hypothetical protein [Rhizobium leguminosarum]
MLTPVIAVCAIVATFFIARHFAAKTRVVDDNLKKIIGDKIAHSDYARELIRLREDNGVMRNLIIDMVENNTNPRILATASTEEKSRLQTDRLKRHRELLAEAVFILQHSEPVKRPPDSQRIDS